MPTQQSGALSRLLWQPEATYGTTPTPAGFVLPFVNHTLAGKVDHVETEAIDGVPNDNVPVNSVETVGGNLVVPVELGNMGKWLQASFGQASSPWGDVSTAPASFVLEDQLAGLTKYVVYNGCRVGSLAFSFGPGAKYQATMAIAAQKRTEAGSSFETTPTAAAALLPISFKHLALSIGGAPVSDFTSFGFTVDFGLTTGTHAIAGGGRETHVLPGLKKVTGTLEKLMTSFDMQTWADAGTPVEIELVATIAAGTTLTITMPTCKIKLPEAGVAGPMGRMSTGSFTAYDATRDGTLGNLISFAIAIAS